MAPVREFGRFADIRHLEETGSTNAEVLALARAGVPEGVVVVADFQSAGRGRRGRTWTAPPGSGLLASVLLRPRLGPAQAPLAGLAAAVAAVEACAEVAGVVPALKWPNDVVVERTGGDGAAGGKLAGLLAESLVEGDELPAVVVGMGLNLTRAPARHRPQPAFAPGPVVPPPGAAYLEDLAGRPVARDDLLGSWLAHLDRWCTTLSSPGGDRAVGRAYRRHCTTLGRWVRVELAAGRVEGLAVDITPEGHLVVEAPTGPCTVAAGDVVHLR
ncbi:MAG: biotin--[acetyl-CoA-carboxylase] ligase [Actinomycetota bacterium]|jgi:BirA family biotin operon repressor/biotin-[acetyl-CoA-carboxylase] ligase|nr:biotin--[acetyl-CoA-carboxylase] ligase [Actinomycetota bacterium]